MDQHQFAGAVVDLLEVVGACLTKAAAVDQNTRAQAAALIAGAPKVAQSLLEAGLIGQDQLGEATRVLTDPVEAITFVLPRTAEKYKEASSKLAAANTSPPSLGKPYGGAEKQASSSNGNGHSVRTDRRQHDGKSEAYKNYERALGLTVE